MSLPALPAPPSRRAVANASFPRRPARGVTLIESLTVLAIVGIAAACALPSWTTLREQRALDGQVAQLVADLQYARQASITAAEPVRFSVPSGANGSCYLIHTGPRDACDCTTDGQAQCVPEAQLLRHAVVGGETGLRVQTRTPSLLIDPTYGTVTPTGALRVTDRRARDVQVVVNLLGRTRTCSAGVALPGYPSC